MMAAMILIDQLPHLRLEILNRGSKGRRRRQPRARKKLNHFLKPALFYSLKSRLSPVYHLPRISRNKCRGMP
jgi:hypothetical protein